MGKFGRISAILLTITAACSHGGAPNEPAPSTATRPTPAARLSVVAGASFRDLDSGVVLAAALVDREPARTPPAPPLSLTASDGTGLALASLRANIVVEGPLAFTELHLAFDNPSDRVIEGQFAITLPPGAAISRLAMRIDERWQEAEVVERAKATRAYEDFLHRRQDPALLEKKAGNEFRARIFPIPARGRKELIVSYSHELTNGTYRLPLRGLPRIGEFAIEARTLAASGAGFQKTELAQRGVVPDADFELAPSLDTAGLRSGELVVVRLRPELPAEMEKIRRVTLLFDTSASRAAGFGTAVARLADLVRELRSLHGDDLELTLATFDQETTPVFSGRVADFDGAALDAVRARRPLGASDLHAALAWLATTGAERVILLSDGIATAGPTDGNELYAAVTALRGKVQRLDVVVDGGIRDEDTLRRLTTGALERDGALLDGELGAAALARRISLTTRSALAVSVPGARWVWPEKLDGVQPGDERLVYASLNAGAGDTIAVNLGDREVRAKLTEVPRPLLERSAAAATIARLGFTRDGLPPEEHDKRAALEREIVDLSVRHRVLSDLTALLVLETAEDYARYGIAQNALSDILTVSSEGLTLVGRKDPVVLAEAAPRREPEKKDTKEAGAPDDGRLDEGAAGAGASEEGAQEPGIPDPEPAPSASAVASAAPEAGPPPPPPPPAPPPRSAPVPAATATSYATGTATSYATGAPAAGTATADSGPESELRGPPPLTGKLAAITALLAAGQKERAVVDALAWRNEEPGDVMALIALGEALEAYGQKTLAARAYGSIIDLFPSRADFRRFAGERLDRLGAAAAPLALDTFTKAVAARPDHLTSHRLLGFALLRAGRFADAFAALETGLLRNYPAGRFASGDRVLREDLGLVAAAWVKDAPGRAVEIDARLAKLGAKRAVTPSLRFVLYWETDANDVDFHILDGRGGHASYREKELVSGGALFADITNGYGPECFAISGKPTAYPYDMRLHYYSRGPMGYGMGKVEVVEHDGAGTLRFEQRPFVVMNDQAYVELGTINGPLAR